MASESAPAAVLQEGVVDALGREIVDGEVLPGHRYTLEGLQDRFEISRTVARDAMRSLESLGLVESRRRVGLSVQASRRWNVHHPRVIRWRLEGQHRSTQYRELAELRIAVEPLAAACAAVRADAAARIRLRELAQELHEHGRAGDADAFLRADIEFHALILNSSGNAMFGSLDEIVGEVLAGRMSGGVLPFAATERSLEAHTGLAAAVAGGDAEEAERLAREVVGEVRDALATGLDPVGETPGMGEGEHILAARRTAGALGK
ncbi:FadR family transcriptional regulator [Galactobacter valiniphilus]|uniref:FadR family transcriptional regulator n=1 Tax=Galactobacter valiniphilus TaxID=2676122 RepID=A0A399JB61_9MICC|nr:FCD domain-containing protein [Galactobacter valiniphilus]RII42300.1 FadR family transcriptional regulator [Galactobacter valiniphilus]